MKFAEKPPQCVGCPAYEWGRGFVPPSGPTNPRLVIIGQGPGEQEAYHSRPFVEWAPAGEMLTGWLHEAGMARSEVMLMNVVQCWLPARYERGLPRGNREPNSAEMQSCYERHIERFIKDQNLLRSTLEWVLVGAPAARFMLGLGPKESVEKWLGVTQRVENPGHGND